MSRSESYDHGNLGHETMLLELWTLLLPDRPLLKRVTKQWQDIGEQDGSFHPRVYRMENWFWFDACFKASNWGPEWGVKRAL